MEIIGVIIAGIIIGVLGKFLAPGVRANVPMWLTILCGIAGVILGWYIYVAFGGNGSPGIDWVRWLIAIAVAAVLVVIASTLTGKVRKRQENATRSRVHGNVQLFGNVPPENLEGASSHQGREHPATAAVVAEPKPTESHLGPLGIDERRPDVVLGQEELGPRHEVSPDREVDSALRLPAPDLPAVPRSALVVATSKYVDPSLRTLRAPATDAVAFAEVLANPDIGGFSVSSERSIAPIMNFALQSKISSVIGHPRSSSCCISRATVLRTSGVGCTSLQPTR